MMEQDDEHAERSGSGPAIAVALRRRWQAPASTAGRTVDGRQAHAERAGVPIAEQRNGDGGGVKAEGHEKTGRAMAAGAPAPAALKEDRQHHADDDDRLRTR